MQMDQEVRPPYVRFERTPVEDRNASIAAGHFVARDVDFAHITRPGSKDTLVKEAKAFIADMFLAANQGRVPLSWPQGFERAYKQWLDGEETPAVGTPIKGWAILSPAQQQSLIQSGILTVEDLSQLSDAELPRVGMGAVSIRQKAQAWLLSAKDTGKAAEQISSLQTQLQELTATLKAQAEVIAQLQAEKSAPPPSTSTLAEKLAARRVN